MLDWDLEKLKDRLTPWTLYHVLEPFRNSFCYVAEHIKLSVACSHQQEHSAASTATPNLNISVNQSVNQQRNINCVGQIMTVVCMLFLYIISFHFCLATLSSMSIYFPHSRSSLLSFLCWTCWFGIVVLFFAQTVIIAHMGADEGFPPLTKLHLTLNVS